MTQEHEILLAPSETELREQPKKIVPIAQVPVPPFGTVVIDALFTRSWVTQAYIKYQLVPTIPDPRLYPPPLPIHLTRIGRTYPNGYPNRSQQIRQDLEISSSGFIAHEHLFSHPGWCNHTLTYGGCPILSLEAPQQPIFQEPKDIYKIHKPLTVSYQTTAVDLLASKVKVGKLQPIPSSQQTWQELPKVQPVLVVPLTHDAFLQVIPDIDAARIQLTSPNQNMKVRATGYHASQKHRSPWFVQSPISLFTQDDFLGPTEETGLATGTLITASQSDGTPLCVHWFQLIKTPDECTLHTISIK